MEIEGTSFFQLTDLSEHRGELTWHLSTGDGLHEDLGDGGAQLSRSPEDKAAKVEGAKSDRI